MKEAARPELAAAAARPPTGHPVWACAFRPFFLLAGIFGSLQMLLWIAALQGRWVPPGPLGATGWHAHEMLFGWATAAVAGFLLTAVPVWTGTRPRSGPALGGLVALWLAGRGAVFLADVLPPVAVGLLAVAFLPVLTLAVAGPILRKRQRRNYAFPIALAGLAGANVAVQLDAMLPARGLAPAGFRAGVGILTLLVVIVGGRITPAFTANALRRRDDPAQVRASPWLDRMAAPSVALLLLLDQLAPRSAWSGTAALFAAVFVLGRMSGWQSRRTLGDPLLWSLHLGHAWVGVGLTLFGFADVTGKIPWNLSVHALTAGAFGATVLAVMTRVGLGHTGRALVAPLGIRWAYLLVSLGAGIRIAGPLALPPDRSSEAILFGGLLWAAAFGIFVLRYAPILTRPRLDGRPG